MAPTRATAPCEPQLPPGNSSRGDDADQHEDSLSSLSCLLNHRNRLPQSDKEDVTQNKISDEFISFLSGAAASDEHPHKRQKLTSHVPKNPTPAGIVSVSIGKAIWDIPALLSRSLINPTLLWRDDVVTRLNFREHDAGQPKRPHSLTILDDERRAVLVATLPDDTQALGDLLLALKVHDDTKKWAKAQGKLWTKFTVGLVCSEDSVAIRITSTIKWNITTSAEYIHHSNNKSPALLSVLSRYFPDSSVDESENWTPQDFYQSVHVPSHNEDVSSMEVPGLKANLFPFQKRTVQWLLRKEGAEWSSTDKCVQDYRAPENRELPMSFVRATTFEGQNCYLSRLFGLITLDVEPFLAMEERLSGGILAEEMGLGKTVEMISLIALHKRAPNISSTVFDRYTGTDILLSGATLIVTPPSILKQWISEINRHAPDLLVRNYRGIKGHSERTASEFALDFTKVDVVVTTYNILAAEIHFTQLNPEKTLRHKAKYPRPKSPLMQVSWFRVCIDEAQMVESGVSNAAVVARMVPRVHAYCLSGTPVRKEVDDLRGLLIFLRNEPYASTNHVWTSLITTHKSEFRQLFNKLALRNSKSSVREELKLPAQRRYVITMPFTPIEEEHYHEMFEHMCNAVKVDAQGTPTIDDWQPEAFIEVMRIWLSRLRQTALHPEIGERNRKALGGAREGSLRTVEQVIAMMIENSEAAIRGYQRSLLISKLHRAQLYENTPQVKKAFEIWNEAAIEAAEIVQECRFQLDHELMKVGNSSKPSSSRGSSRPLPNSIDESSDEAEEAESSSRSGVLRNRLRESLKIEHMAVFFRANAYYQIKINQDLTEPGSPEFNELERLETEGYDEAKKLRREILQEVYGKAEKIMSYIAKKGASQSFTQIPEFPTRIKSGGVESRTIVKQLDDLAAALDAQADYLDELRNKTIQLLCRPLVDEDDGVELTGDEYEKSTETQGEVMIFIQVLRTMIADRHDALTGQENALVKQDIKSTLRLAKSGEAAFSEITLDLLNIRQKFKPEKNLGSVREILSNLKGLVLSLKFDSNNGDTRASNELQLVEGQLAATQKKLSVQMKIVGLLDKEAELFTRVVNARLEYYRQLQAVSDMVAPYEGFLDDEVAEIMCLNEQKDYERVANAKAKHRYLLHLKEEEANPKDQRICVICRDPIEVGLLTVCGHQYCNLCMKSWWAAHKNCPMCKRKLRREDFYDITYKPQELSIQIEDASDGSHRRAQSTLTNKKSSIYAEISKSTLAEIKNIELRGPSFTTKVDTLARHLIWLRESDPGAKSIIYSQFKDFLAVLADAFQVFRIGCVSIDDRDGIEKFKNDPSIECFLLHSRAHSSGLNLVNASHVFLCEPLLNTALELQAIARVDRIGQQQETNVWLYLVDGTVEQSIHQLSVRRRMEHIGQYVLARPSRKGKEREISPEELVDSKLEEANSLELEQAKLTDLLVKGTGGEKVANEDVWECLFGAVQDHRLDQNEQGALANSNIRFDPVVGGYLRAEAAEERRAQA